MSGQIRMTPEQLKQRAKMYVTGSEKIDEVLRDLTNVQRDLAAEWEGQAFGKFDEQFNQLVPKVQNFSNLLREINTQLENTAEAVRLHDEQLSRNFGLQ
jgi:WXG100 family type VII secretion target